MRQLPELFNVAMLASAFATMAGAQELSEFASQHPDSFRGYSPSPRPSDKPSMARLEFPL